MIESLAVHHSESLNFPISSSRAPLYPCNHYKISFLEKDVYMIIVFQEISFKVIIFQRISTNQQIYFCVWLASLEVKYLKEVYFLLLLVKDDVELDLKFCFRVSCSLGNIIWMSNNNYIKVYMWRLHNYLSQMLAYRLELFQCH